MSKPTTRSKPRYGLFNVGSKKANPARAASIRRASIRRSGILTEPPKPHLNFEPEPADAGATAEVEASRQLRTLPEIVHRAHGPSALTADCNSVPATHLENNPIHPPPSPYAAIQHTSASDPRKSSPATRPLSTNPAMASPPGSPQHGASLPSKSQTQQPNFLRRLTSKLQLRTATMPLNQSTKPPRDEVTRKGTFLRMPPVPKPAVPGSDFTSSEQRQAALRARGLRPAASAASRRFRDAEGYMMPLSEQEAEIDRRYTVLVPGDDEDSETDAKKIREAWLAKQSESATAPMWNYASQDISRREGDAMERASKDGPIGDKSPVRATFVNAPTLSPGVGEIGASPTGQTFHASTSPSFPRRLAERRLSTGGSSRAGSPPLCASPSPEFSEDIDFPDVSSGRSSAEKVSRWLRISSDILSNDEAPTPVAQSLSVRSRKEKPPPIIVTSHRPFHDGKPPTQVITVAIAAPLDSEGNSSEGDTSLEAQDSAPRGLHVVPSPLAHDPSVSSTSSTLPALSPTRTVSSSGAESSLPTPTTVSCARETSISRGSSFYSSDNGHDVIGRPRRGTGDVMMKASLSAVIPEEYSEVEQPVEATEHPLGANTPSGDPTHAPRPTLVQVAEQARAKQQNRKSLSLFGKRSIDVNVTKPPARTSSSMSNLRRAFVSTKPRPKSTLDPVPSVSEVVRKRSKMFDASHLPASPTFPQPRPHQRLSISSSSTNSVGSRRGIAPTMHTPATIMQQTHLIVDEESRRLSEMAFLI